MNIINWILKRSSNDKGHNSVEFTTADIHLVNSVLRNGNNLRGRPLVNRPNGNRALHAYEQSDLEVSSSEETRIKIPGDEGSEYNFYHQQRNFIQDLVLNKPFETEYYLSDLRRKGDGFLEFYLDRSEHIEGTEVQFDIGCNSAINIPDFQEHVVCTGRFEVKHHTKKTDAIFFTYHKFMGVNTKRCIKLILERLKSQINCDRIYDTCPFPSYETFMENKFMLRIPTGVMDVEKMLTKFLTIPTQQIIEFKSTISFCQLMTTTGKPCSITLVKDLTADLRRVIWNFALDIQEKSPRAIELIKEEKRADYAILVPYGKYYAKDVSNDNKLPSYRAAIEERSICPRCLCSHSNS